MITDKASHIFKHLSESTTCRQSCTEHCFKVIDTTNTSFQLKIKKALQIYWKKPILNKQMYHFDLKFLLESLLKRKYGNIIPDLAAKYDGNLLFAVFRKLEKLSFKVRKATLDLNFLQNCKSLNVFPKFVSFNLTNKKPKDITAIRKKILRSAITKRSKEVRQLNYERDKKLNELKKGFE